MPFRPIRRGSGLGNALIPWAKAFIASRELNATLLSPTWGLNPRGYRRDFGTSRLDWLAQLGLLALLPQVSFSESEFLECGETDYAVALGAFAKRTGLRRRSAFVFVADGMWGGFQALESARTFVLGELLKARWVRENMFDWARALPRERLTVAVHIRLGDFRPVSQAQGYQGQFNASIPIEWYSGICRALRARFGSRVQFSLHSDGNQTELSEFVREFQPFRTARPDRSSVSDLLCMAKADLLVCSVSSYSMWAAFLSDRPYLWFAPHLQEINGLRSIWGHETSQGPPNGTTFRNAMRMTESLQSDGDGAIASCPRGVPVALPPVLPDTLLVELEHQLASKSSPSDLVRCGVVHR